MKKNYQIVGFSVIGIALAAILMCFTSAFAETKSVYNKNYNLANLHTWSFANFKVATSDPTGANPIWDDMLRQDLANDFSSAGYSTGDRSAADFVVRYHLGTKEKVRTEYFNDFPGFARYNRGWLYWRGGWGRDRTVYRIPYNETTLVVDILDARTNQLIWRGYDWRTIDLDKSDKSLQKSAKNIVDRFKDDVKKSAKQNG